MGPFLPNKICKICKSIWQKSECYGAISAESGFDPWVLVLASEQYLLFLGSVPYGFDPRVLVLALVNSSVVFGIFPIFFSLFSFFFVIFW